MKKKILALMMALMLICSMAFSVSAAETDGAALSLQVSTGKGSVTVCVRLEGCEGVTNGRFTVGYDAEALTLVDVETSDVYAVDSINDTVPGQLSFAWVGSDLEAGENLMLTLTLEIAEGCTRDLTYSVEENGIYNENGAVAVSGDVVTVAYNAPTDFSALEQAVAVAQALRAEDYSADSYAEVTAALEEAMLVLANADATQAEVDAAAKTLNDAIAALRPSGSADVTALKAAIKDAESLNEELYTEDSFAAMEAALEEAKEVLANVEATQDEVDAAAKALNDAMDALVLTAPNAPSGDNSNVGFWMIVLITSVMAAAAVVLAMVRAGKAKKVCRVLSMVLAFATLLTLMPVGSLAIIDGEQGDGILSNIQDLLNGDYVIDGEDNSFVGTIKEVFNQVFDLKQEQNVSSLDEYYADTDLVRVIVELEGDCLLDQGYTMDQISAYGEAVSAAAAKLEAVQDYIAIRINDVVKDSGLSSLDVSVKYHYTAALNGIAVTVPYGALAAIRKISGVKGAYVTTEYMAPESTESTDSPSMYATSESFGSAQVWQDLGYTGKGMVIAVIDTGLDVDHPSFADAPEGAAISYADVEAVLTELNAYKLFSQTSALALTADDLYYNEKIPFGFNYVDCGIDVTHDFDDQGDHGTHVSGIACANKLETTSVVGVAPDAQVVVIKVFGQNGGAYFDDIMAGIEDCILLDVDVINMSLGSPAGFTEDYALATEVYGRILEHDMMMAVAAGNIPSTASGNALGTNLNFSSDPDVGIANSPSTYLGATCVASSENHYVMMPYFSMGEEKYPFAVADYSTLYNFTSLAGEHEYVVVPGVGDVSDYEGLDVTGKIVLVQRGTITFPDKEKNAYDHGAIAMICYDNVDGALVSMSPGGYIPGVFIAKKHGEALVAAAENGVGTLTVQPHGEETPIKNGNGGQMSDFSAWGVTADLQLAPDVTAPGGNIYSCYTDGQYGTMSGTSMACPHIAGMSALVLEYLHDVYPDLEETEYHVIAESLVMCTAEPAIAPNGIHYSPRTQGAGFANVYNAVSSPVYLTSYQSATGELTPKASMGDDPSRTGVFTFTFDMNNLTDAAQTYVLDFVLMTDQYLTLEGWGDQEFFGEEGRYLTGNVSYAFPNAGVLTGYDFNSDDASDMNDVQYLLDAANALIEASAELDLNGDGVTDTRDAQHLYEIVSDAIETQNRITVPAGGSVSVTVTVSLSEEDMAYMDAHYENGTFVDGFVRAYAETEGAVDLSLPFMGFYGGWDEAPIFDSGWYYEDEDERIYNRYMHVIFATMGSDYNYGGLGMNPYFDEEYSSEHNVLSPNGDGYYDYVPEIYVSLMRSAELLDFTWTDDATGETLFYEYYTYARKGYYWNAYGMAMPIIYTDGGCMPYTFYDDNGELMVEDLQHITLTIRGYLDDGELDDCYINDYGVPVPDTDWADGTIEIPVVIDMSAPTINMDSLYYYTDNGRNYVTFEVEDNYDIAAVVATTMGGGAYEYIPVTTKTPGVDGEKDTITLDITDYDASFQIVLCDYGCNETYYELANVQSNGLNEEEFYAFRRYSTIETSSTIYTTDQLNGWYSFLSADYMLQHTSQTNSGEATVYAAEYVDGYIFGAQAGSKDYNTLFVSKSGSWDRIQLGNGNQMNKTVYEWPGEDGSYFPLKMIALDMTYDYTTGTMYMLANAMENNYFPDGEINILLSVDLETGNVTILGKIFVEDDPSFLALTLACDTDGTLYTINYENGMLYTIDKEPAATTERYGYGTYLATCVDADGVSQYYPAAYTQSMTFDHATGELYWAAYQGKTGQAAFINMDKTTGEIKNLTYTVNNAEMVGLFKPWDSGEDIIADAALTDISLRKDNLHMSIGQTTAIGVLPAPYNAALGTITYTSGDPSVATVNAYGTVVAVGIGTTEIEVVCTTESGETFTALCSVNVSNVSGTLFAYSGGNWLLMDAGTPGGASQVADAMELEGTVSASAYRDGYLYVATVVEDYDEDWNLIYSTNLYKLNASTLHGELLASFDGKVTALAFNYDDGFMYGLLYSESFDSRYNQTITYSLIRVHMMTGQTLVVDNLNEMYPYSDRAGDYCVCSGALAIDYEGNFYVSGDNADWEYNLYRFNLDENDQICNMTEFTGFLEYNYSGDSMVWSQRNGGIIYASGTELYWLDVSDMENVQIISLGEIRGASGYTVALAIPVSNEPHVEGVTPTEVMLEDVYTVPQGESIHIIPSMNPWNASGEFTYTVADESVAMVDENGYVTGLTIGTTTVLVTEVSSGLTATATIEVVKNPGYLYGYLQAYISQGVPMEVWGKLPISNVADYDFMTDIYALTIYAAAYYDGTVYACGMHTTDGKYYLMKISPSNFYYNIVDQSDLLLRDMAFDYTTGTMYAVGYTEAIHGGLYQVNLETLELTLVADNDLGTQLVTLACDDEGVLYTSNGSGELFTMDKSTGKLTSTGIYGSSSPYLQSMVYDYNNDTIYWAAGGSIYQVDAEHGTMAVIGTNECVVSGLFTVPYVNPSVPETVDPAGVVLDEKNTVAVGNELTIDAVVLPVSVATVDQSLTWTTSDASVATVNGGVVTGVSAGTCYITATDAKGNSDTILITVTEEERFFYGYDELSASWVQFGFDGQVLQTWADAEGLSPIVAAQYIEGTLYAYDRDGYFYSVDTETFQRTLLGDGISKESVSLEAWDKTHDEQVYYVDGVPYMMVDMTYHTENGETTLYGVMMAWNISLWRDDFSYKIVTLSMETGEIQEVIVQDQRMDGMDMRPSNIIYRGGALYCIDGFITGMISRIDLSNNGLSIQAICPDYWGDFNGGRSMIEDPLTGTIYAIRDMRTEYIGTENYTGTFANSVLYTMELGIGRIDEVCTIGSNMRIVGMFIK